MLKIMGITKKFGNKCVLNEVSFCSKQGSITGVIGPSGSGKSTLLNIIGQLDTEYEGVIEINNKKYDKNNRKYRIQLLRNEIFYLFQNYALVDDETVYENLMIALEYSGLSKDDKIEKMETALKKVGLSPDFLKMMVFTLSGGEQQRVSLARVYLKPSSIILADEPTGNLDVKNRDIVFSILNDLAHKENKIVIIVSHDPEAINYCDSIIEL